MKLHLKTKDGSEEYINVDIGSFAILVLISNILIYAIMFAILFAFRFF